MHVFEVVSSFDVSVMAHMGMGFSFADPVNIYLMAKSFPDVRIAIAHAGENFPTQWALYFVQAFDTICLEPSSSDIKSIMLLLGGSSARCA